jgi:heat shock protein HtpX
MFKRITLFILTNILVLTAISIISSVLGIGNYIEQSGINYQTLMATCLLWGMVGSFISLALSRIMAKWMMGVKLIDPKSPGRYEWYIHTTYEISKRAGLSTMPQVGVFESPDVNAFATGPTKNRSLVAASSSLLETMSKDEIEGVIAHEVAHITNGDMVTMTLVQGVINAFVMFFARVIAYAVAQNVKDSAKQIVHTLTIIVLQIAFGFLGMIVVGWFSRKREFRADAGSAKLVGANKMKAALQALQRIHGKIQLPEEQHQSVAALQISNNYSKSNFAMLFSTHPPLEERISALDRREAF